MDKKNLVIKKVSLKKPITPEKRRMYAEKRKMRLNIKDIQDFSEIMNYLSNKKFITISDAEKKLSRTKLIDKLWGYLVLEKNLLNEKYIKK